MIIIIVVRNYSKISKKKQSAVQAQSRPSPPELTTRSRGQVIDTVRASATKVALMRRRVEGHKWPTEERTVKVSGFHKFLLS